MFEEGRDEEDDFDLSILLDTLRIHHRHHQHHHQ